MRRIAFTVIVVASLAAPAAAQDAPLRESATRIAAAMESQPQTVGRGGTSAGKMATALGLVGGGLAMVFLGKPDLAPSQFTPSVVPGRIDLSAYLGPGTYPGHSYTLTHRRGDDYSTHVVARCRGRTSGVICPADVGGVNEWLRETYRGGYTDGHDDGVHAGMVAGHEQGWTEGQTSVLQIMDENGFTVYEGPFIPASYVRERLEDRQALRLGGAALLAAGAIAALAWPDSAPVESLDVAPLPGGGWLGATVGF